MEEGGTRGIGFPNCKQLTCEVCTRNLLMSIRIGIMLTMKLRIRIIGLVVYVLGLALLCFDDIISQPLSSGAQVHSATKRTNNSKTVKEAVGLSTQYALAAL